MTGLSRRWLWPPGTPRFPLTVAGHGRIGHAYLPAAHQRRLHVLTETAPPARWGVLFVIDGRGRKWTLYSPDPDYTALFAPAAHTLDLDVGVFAAKFPGWNAGWAVS